MPKYATVACDSVGELARLFFSFDLKKHSADMNSIRQMNNYPGATERVNMFVRRQKQHRNQGVEIVFTAHEDIEKIYARGSGMAGKGQAPPDPVAVKGWPDIPGKRAPDEFCRAVDNVLRVTRQNVGGFSKPCWMARRDPIGVGSDYWEVKDRFNGPALNGGILPADYTLLRELAIKQQPESWQAPYIWMLYGPFGIGKTRSLRSFPKPIKLFSLDHGHRSLTKAELEGIDVEDSIDVEESDDYTRFIGLWEASF
jgi:hypothetical protein